LHLKSVTVDPSIVVQKRPDQTIEYPSWGWNGKQWLRNGKH
jgi:hypothetical protein